MNVKMCLVLLLLGFLVLIGCTGCDPNGGATIDLTRNVEVLTVPLGWQAQEDYEVVDFRDISYQLELLYFGTTDFGVSVSYEESDRQIGTSTVEMPDEGAVSFESYETGYHYTVRITASEESDPVLTLTEVETERKMYFSMVTGT